MKSASDILHDPDIAGLGRSGRSIQAGPWTLVLPRVFGFCGGVLNALHMLRREIAAQPPPGTVWLLGEIIHNESVNDHFRGLGVKTLSEAAGDVILEPIAPGDTVVIPAFGLPREPTMRLAAAAAAGKLRLIDTTCAYVKRIWTFAEAQARAGATVLILGKPDHPETRATLSRSLGGENAAVLLADADAVQQVAVAIRAGRLPQAGRGVRVHHAEAFSWRQMALVVQTTLLYEETQQAEALLREAAEGVGALFHSAATICRATEERQHAALELCHHPCDLILVIGGFSSSNTTQLYRLASSYAPTYFVRTAAAFDRHQIEHFLPADHRTTVTRNWLPEANAVIGLLSGASCPPGDVGGVIRKLKALAGE
jgi:4-hydroxy-3-methylbut-2-enyl diphosphate reductase